MQYKDHNMVTYFFKSTFTKGHCFFFFFYAFKVTEFGDTKRCSAKSNTTTRGHSGSGVSRQFFSQAKFPKHWSDKGSERDEMLPSDPSDPCGSNVN